MIKPSQLKFSRKLRREESEAERNLWSRLRNHQIHGAKFRRQETLGDYIVDFVSFEKKLIIEIDGGQHNEAGIRKRDEVRTSWLESNGFKVIRFWDNDVLENIDGVLEIIQLKLKSK
jgi:very-short-patch-repair endonuclease